MMTRRERALKEFNENRVKVTKEDQEMISDKLYMNEDLFSGKLIGFAKSVIRDMPTNGQKNKAVQLLEQLVDCKLLEPKPAPKKATAKRAS